MQTEITYKIQLDNGSKKFICPGCGKKTFVRMKDFETGEYLPEHVGRCDRENNCGYHFTLKQYLADTGLGYENNLYKNEVAAIERKTDFMPLEYVEKSMTGYTETHFASFMISLFGFKRAAKALRKYFVGRSKNDNGKACIFWRIDKDEMVRTGKIMCYNPNSGKRDKEKYPTWVHTKLQSFNYQLCFFGEHLLTEHPEKNIGIVESEKTAIIASMYMPEMVWLATGGNSGCKWREYSVYKVLQNRTVIFYPDYGYYNKKTLKTCFEEWSERANHIQEKINCTVKVSGILENSLNPNQRVNDYDLADFLIKREDDKGPALTDYDYPASWDFCTNN